VVRSTDGEAFGGKETLPHRSSHRETTENGFTPDGFVVNTTPSGLHGPSLAATGRGVHLGWRGGDGRVDIARLGAGPAGHVVLPERTDATPALAPAADGMELLLVWAGTDRHLNVSETHADTFGPGQLWAHTTFVSPAALTHEGRLVMAWTGTDRHVNVAVAGRGVPPTATWLEVRTGAAPALCRAGDELLVAWTGTDLHLNMLSLGFDGYVRGTATLDGRSSHGPALAVHRGAVHLAWAGTNGRINVARLGRAS
jgi:hypothetical protein